MTADVGEPIEIPEDAIGVTTGAIGTMVTVHFLVSVEENGELRTTRAGAVERDQ